MLRWNVDIEGKIIPVSFPDHGRPIANTRNHVS